MEKRREEEYNYQFICKAEPYILQDLKKTLENQKYDNHTLKKIDDAFILLSKNNSTQYEREDVNRVSVIYAMLNKGNKEIQDYIIQNEKSDLQILMRSLRVSGINMNTIITDFYNHLNSAEKIRKLSNIITVDHEKNYYDSNIIGKFKDILISGINKQSINNLLECDETDVINLIKIMGDHKIYEYNHKPHNVSDSISRYFDFKNKENTISQAKKIIDILLQLEYDSQILIYSGISMSSMMENGSLSDMMLHLETEQSLEIINELITELRSIGVSNKGIFYIIYDIFNNRIPSMYFNPNKFKNKIEFNIRNIAPYSIKEENIEANKLYSVLDKVFQKLIVEYNQGSYEWIQ